MATTATQQPFKNEQEEKDFFLEILRAVNEGGIPWISRKRKGENTQKQKNLLQTLSAKGFVIFKKRGRIFSPAYAQSLGIKEITIILRICQYTKEQYEYDVETGELIISTRA